MAVFPLVPGRNSAMGPQIFPRPPLLGSVIRRHRAAFRIGPPRLIKTATSRGPHWLWEGAQSNHKDWDVNSSRVNISLLVVIISDYSEIGADHGRYKLISVVESDQWRRGGQNRRFLPRDGPISREIPLNSQVGFPGGG